MSESDDTKAPLRLTPKEALAQRRAEHMAWKQQFFHSRPPPVCLGRLHRRQASPIGRSVAESFKRARELIEQGPSPAVSQKGGETASERVAAPLGHSGSPSDAVTDLDTLPPRLRRRHAWCARMQIELASRNPATDVQIRSDPRRTLVFSHLHSDSTEGDVRLFAEQIGHVESVRLIRNKKTGASRRYAFVEYRYVADVTKAVQFSGKKRLHGRVIHIDIERGRTEAGFLPQRLTEAIKYTDPGRNAATHEGATQTQQKETAPVTAQTIKAMSDDDFLNAMLNL